MKSDLIPLAALWENTSSNGEIYYTGKLGDARIVVFKNGFKKEPKHPDWRIYVSPPEEKKEDVPF